MSQEIVLYNDNPVEAEPLRSVPMLETGVSKVSRRKFDRHYYAECLVKSAMADPTTVASSSKAQSYKPHSYECDICGKTFSSHHALGGHKSSHKSNKRSHDESKNTGKSRKRPTCFTTSSETKSASSLLPEKPTKEGQIASSSKAIFECDKCHKTFSTYQALGGHKSSHFYNKNNKTDQPTHVDKSHKRPAYLKLFPDSPSQTTSTSYQLECTSSCLEDIDLELRL